MKTIGIFIAMLLMVCGVFAFTCSPTLNCSDININNQTFHYCYVVNISCEENVNITLISSYLANWNSSYYDYLTQKSMALNVCAEDNKALREQNANLTDIKNKFDMCLSDKISLYNQTNDLKNQITGLNTQISSLNQQLLTKESEKSTYLIVGFIVGLGVYHFILSRKRPEDKIREKIGKPRIGE